MTNNAIPTGYMTDAKGRLVPEAMVKPADKLEDQLVRKILAYANDLNAQIARFKGHCFDDVAAFLTLRAEEYGVKMKEGAKGNMTLTTYDGAAKVVIAVADTIKFGATLQIAKELIDDCIREWAEGSRSEIRALVEHAFRVDKEGEVSREAIFQLRRIEIEDARWQRAMRAIADSIQVVGSKTYIRFYRRPRPDMGFKNITIDLASAELPEAFAVRAHHVAEVVS